VDRATVYSPKCHHQKKSETRLILIFDGQVRHCRIDRGVDETQVFVVGDALRNVVTRGTSRLGM
jgi:hypothetical protein